MLFPHAEAGLPGDDPRPARLEQRRLARRAPAAGELANGGGLADTTWADEQHALRRVCRQRLLDLVHRLLDLISRLGGRPRSCVAICWRSGRFSSPSFSARIARSLSDGSSTGSSTHCTVEPQRGLHGGQLPQPPREIHAAESRECLARSTAVRSSPRRRSPRCPVPRREPARARGGRPAACSAARVRSAETGDPRRRHERCSSSGSRHASFALGGSRMSVKGNSRAAVARRRRSRSAGGSFGRSSMRLRRAASPASAAVGPEPGELRVEQRLTAALPPARPCGEPAQRGRQSRRP